MTVVAAQFLIPHLQNDPFLPTLITGNFAKCLLHFPNLREKESQTTNRQREAKTDRKIKKSKDRNIKKVKNERD